MAQYCNGLSSRTGFSEYIALLRNVTNDDFSLIKNCRVEICGALWGLGNPDVSGIGMAVGYLLESAICVCLLCAHVWRSVSNESRFGFRSRILSVAAATFYDNALFFAFAIQAASVVTLAQANFGMGADGMGAITMKIAWTVSTLTLLPLLPLLLRSQVFAEAFAVIPPANESCVTTIRMITGDDRETVDRYGDVDKSLRARQSHRLLLFVLCWSVSFYPFFSRMVGTFGESQIGDTSGSAISTIDWARIQNICFENVETISTNEEMAMTAFGAGGWLLIATVVIYMIVLSTMKAGERNELKWLKQKGLTFEEGTTRHAYLWLLVCVAVVALLVAHFWAFFRLRRFQSDMTMAAGGIFPDSQWSFGQIVAVVIFFPVAAEMLYCWSRRPRNTI